MRTYQGERDRDRENVGEREGQTEGGRGGVKGEREKKKKYFT